MIVVVSDARLQREHDCGLHELHHLAPEVVELGPGGLGEVLLLDVTLQLNGVFV